MSLPEQTKNSRWRRLSPWIKLLLLTFLLVLVLGAIKAFNVYQMIQGFKAMQNVKQVVSTTQAVYQTWNSQLHATGDLKALRGTMLAVESSGLVERIHFKSGQQVSTNTLLVSLRANEDRAKLTSLKTNAKQAADNYQRDRAQYKIQAVSKSQLQNAEATMQSARAAVSEQQAQLAKKVVRAPFSGTIGIRLIDQGQYVQPGTKVADLQSTGTMLVDFSIPQQYIQNVRKNQRVTVRVDAFEQSIFEGKINATNSRVDQDTRNLMVQARVPNPDKKLLPGMFARVTIESNQEKTHLTLPQTAITYSPYGESVYVVTTAGQLYKEKQNKAEQSEAQQNKSDPPTDPDLLVAKQVFVKLGPTRGDQVAVLSGLNTGDTVVTSGQIKLSNGAAIKVSNKVVPANDPAPKPADE